MIETSRQRLVPLSHELLQLFKNDHTSLAQNLQIDKVEPHDDPETMPHLLEAIEFWLDKTSQYRDHYEWYTNWLIIIKDQNVAIGGIGFTGQPDIKSETMVGYGVNSAYAGKGYATEALRGLIQWGFANPLLKTILADTPLEHVASHKVLLKNSFTENDRDQELVHWKLVRK